MKYLKSYAEKYLYPLESILVVIHHFETELALINAHLSTAYYIVLKFQYKNQTLCIHVINLEAQWLIA